MRVIESGKKPEEAIFTVTCTNCRCKFEFARREAKETFDRNEAILHVNCPECGRENFAYPK